MPKPDDVKRLFDVVVGVLALILLTPLMLVVALLIRFDSPGPALFRQQRVGLGGREFSICKFRSMAVSRDPDAPYNTQVNDPRITAVGKFIRATSIDELPQLINVVKGEMSIVGPRPDLPRMERDYDPSDWRLRHSVRPGITGLAQVNGRSSLGFEDRLRYDLEYAGSPGFFTDLRILGKTLALVFARRDTN